MNQRSPVIDSPRWVADTGRHASNHRRDDDRYVSYYPDLAVPGAVATVGYFQIPVIGGADDERPKRGSRRASSIVRSRL
jgi:hypothetical protein